MSLPAGNRSIRDNNRIPLLYAVSYLNPNQGVQVTADPATGAILTSAAGGSSTVTANQGTPNTNANAWPVNIENFPGTQPVSLAVNTPTIAAGTNAIGTVGITSLPALPAGTNSIGSISNTSFTATQATGANLHVDVDNLPATQPVSGTVTANAGTNLNTSTLALEAGGNLATLTADNNQRYGGGLTPYAKILTTSDSITPATGKSLQVNWVAFIPDSDNSSANQVTVGFNAGATLYIGYAMSHWEPFTGAVNQVLDITLANAQPVSVMVQYRSV